MKKTLVYLLLVMITANSCKKDEDLLVPDQPTPETTWYSVIPANASSNALRTSLKPASATGSFTVFSGATTSWGNGPVAGLTLTIPQGALTNDGNGQPFYGNANATIQLLKTNGDFIKMGIPTTSNSELLLSGGSAYLKLEDMSGNNLSVTPGEKVYIAYEDTPLYQQMKVYNGKQLSETQFNWTADTATALNFVDIANTYYLVNTNKMGWFGAAYPYPGGGSTGEAKIAVNLPSHYTNANSIAFISFDDMKSVVALSGDAVTRQFRSVNIPAGKPVTVVVMSKQVNDYYIGHTQITTSIVTSPSEYQAVTVSPTISSLQDIEAYLSTL